MTIQVEWDNAEQTILRYTFETNWNWKEFYAAKAQATALVSTVNHNVVAIFDTPERLSLPSNTLSQSRPALAKLHPNTLAVVMVVGNSYVRSVMNMIMKLSERAANKFVLVNTLAEARATALDLLEKARISD